MREIFRRAHSALGVILAAAALLSCGTEKKQTAETTAAAPAKIDVPRPADESRRFPKTNLSGTKLVERELMGKSFMPGGTLATYKKGKSEYEMFLAKAGTATDAAIILSEWRKALTQPKLVASFGGYFGQDDGTPLFVFSKGPWVAGVKGLPEKDADLQARIFASQVPAQ